MNYNLEKHTGWVTYLASDSHLYFVLHLYKCLQEVKTKYPFFVVLNDGISEEVQLLLQEVGIRTLKINQAPMLLNTLTADSSSYWINSIKKFYCFSLNGFDKIVYIDPFVEVYKNIDTLFKKPHGTNFKNFKLIIWDFTEMNLSLGTLEAYLKVSNSDNEVFKNIFKYNTNEVLEDFKYPVSSEALEASIDYFNNTFNFKLSKNINFDKIINSEPRLNNNTHEPKIWFLPPSANKNQDNQKKSPTDTKNNLNQKKSSTNTKSNNNFLYF